MIDLYHRQLSSPFRSFGGIVISLSLYICRLYLNLIVEKTSNPFGTKRLALHTKRFIKHNNHKNNANRNEKNKDNKSNANIKNNDKSDTSTTKIRNTKINDNNIDNIKSNNVASTIQGTGFGRKEDSERRR